MLSFFNSNSLIEVFNTLLNLLNWLFLKLVMIEMKIYVELQSLVKLKALLIIV